MRTIEEISCGGSKRLGLFGTLVGVSPDFDAFFRESYSPVVGALRLVVGSREVAEDAAQHGFVKALGRWRRVGAMENPVGWVYVVALRFARSSRRWDPPPAGESESGGSEVMQVVDREMLREAIGELTPRQRVVFVLRHVADLSAVEVADSLDIEPSTVRVLDHQARVRLRNVLGDEYRCEENLDAV